MKVAVASIWDFEPNTFKLQIIEAESVLDAMKMVLIEDSWTLDDPAPMTVKALEDWAWNVGQSLIKGIEL